ncbi:MAG TPA: type II secretion system F family protein [Stellaceae bacterium]|nr:type II secretion system F family protein [Stellaceae bacterium]
MSVLSDIGTAVISPFGWASDAISALNETSSAALAGIAVLVTFIVIGCAFVPRDAMSTRMRSHLRRRDKLRNERLQKKPRSARTPRVPVGMLRHILDPLKLLSGEEAKRSTEILARAGWRSRDALPIFMALRAALPLAFGAGAIFALTANSEMALTYRLLATTFAAIIGAYMPILGLNRLIVRRQNQIRMQLPDALDLLVICAEAGLGLDAGLGRVVRELGGAAPQLADELGLTAVELGFFPDRRQALQNLAKRTDLPAIRGVVNTLIQTERYGTPLANSLRVLAAEFRDERMLKAEEKAARLPAILTVPMIVFILPTLFVVLMGPAIIQVMEHFHH